METFSALLAISAGNSPVSGEISAQRPVTRSFDVFFISARINGWVNNREAGDLRRIRPHYDVTVMLTLLALRLERSWGNQYHGCCCAGSLCRQGISSIRDYTIRSSLNTLVLHIGQTLQWRHHEHDGISYHRCLDGLLNRFFRRR